MCIYMYRYICCVTRYMMVHRRIWIWIYMYILYVYVYVYIYMYTHTCVRIYIYIYMYSHVCTHAHIHIYIYMHIHLPTHTLQNAHLLHYKTQIDTCHSKQQRQPSLVIRPGSVAKLPDSPHRGRKNAGMERHGPTPGGSIGSTGAAPTRYHWWVTKELSWLVSVGIPWLDCIYSPQNIG